MVVYITLSLLFCHLILSGIVSIFLFYSYFPSLQQLRYVDLGSSDFFN